MKLKLLSTAIDVFCNFWYSVSDVSPMERICEPRPVIIILFPISLGIVTGLGVGMGTKPDKSTQMYWFTTSSDLNLTSGTAGLARWEAGTMLRRHVCNWEHKDKQRPAKMKIAWRKTYNLEVQPHQYLSFWLIEHLPRFLSTTSETFLASKDKAVEVGPNKQVWKYIYTSLYI